MLKDMLGNDRWRTLTINVIVYLGRNSIENVIIFLQFLIHNSKNLLKSQHNSAEQSLVWVKRLILHLNLNNFA
jgi:hypothetical protein